VNSDTTSGDISAPCQSDENVVGGGFESDGDGVEALKNVPDSANKKFVVKVKNNNKGAGGNRQIKAYAMCMRISNP
jgi:hypothetical protein